MLRRLEESAGNVLGYEVGDEVTAEDLEAFAQDFEAGISRHGKVRVLLLMPAVPRIDPGALWEDLKLVRYRNAVERYAVVGGGSLTGWAVRLDSALIEGKIRRFDASRYGEAWRWLREPGDA